MRAVGEQAEESGREEEAQHDADGFCAGRTGGSRAHPRPAEGADEKRDEVCGDALDLEDEVAEMRADWANPVANGAWAGSVEGWVSGAIGEERKEKEEPGGGHQQADEFIQAAVAGRGEDQSNGFHRGHTSHGDSTKREPWPNPQ